MKTAVTFSRHTITLIRTGVFVLTLLGTTVLPMFSDLPSAFAGTDTYPTSIAGCRYVSTGGSAGTCDLKNSAQDYYYDPWGEENRECTSYAAWMLHSVNGFEMPFYDSAYNWGPRAQALGYTPNMTPAVGSIYWKAGTGPSHTGQHVAWVESVSTDGSTVTIEDYNSDYAGHWNEYAVSATSASGYIHFKDLSNSDSGTLYFIKTTNTDSGTVEVHSATPGSAYQAAGMHVTTRFNPADASNGWFQMVGADLYFIKTKNTTSGSVEVHTATAASNYTTGIDTTTAFSPSDANNGWFQMTTAGDLVFIKTTNTSSGKVEFFRASKSSNYGTIVTASTTYFSPADASNGWFQALGLDLVFIKTKNTGSGKVEYFRAPASLNYQNLSVATATVLSPADANNGWYSTEDVNSDGTADLAFIKNHNTGSGNIEVFFVYGSGYQTVNLAKASWISGTDANNGWFLIDSKD